MKQLEVQIMGQSYLLGCPAGGEQRLLEAVEKVDTAMCKIRDAGKVKARDRIAVLAALNLAFDTPARAPAQPLRPQAKVPPHMLAIGASTGGIHALGQLLGSLTPRVKVPILITQHLPNHRQNNWIVINDKYASR